jgi:cytochrome P450
MVIAGSETPAKVLSLIMYHLLNNREMLEKVRSEVKPFFVAPGQEPRLHELEQLPFLSAVIKEGLRLHGGIVARSQRVAREPLQYRNYTIPPGTPLSTSSYFIHRNPIIFPEPSEFDPGRWLSSRNQPELDRHLVAFGRGTRNCVGKNLGQAELYMTLAAIIARFDMRLFDTDEKVVGMGRDWYVMQPKRWSQGVRATITGTA